MPVIQHLWNQLITKVNRKRETQVIDLPYDIKVNILSKLPAELLYHCAQLSIPLKKLISQQSFIDSNLLNNSSSWQSVQGFQKYLIGPLDNRKLRVNFIDNSSGNKVKRYYKVCFNREEDHPDYSYFRVFASCNGLLLYINDDSGLILNPITEQHLIVKKPDWHDVIHGFFFHSRTRDYKIICSRFVEGGGFQYMIYSVMTKSWRLLLNDNPNRLTVIQRYKPEAPVIVNDLLHWIGSFILDSIGSPATEVMSFDIDREEWGKIATPHGVRDKLLKLQQTQRLLCLCDLKSLNPKVIDIWVLEDYYHTEKGWIKIYVINLADAIPYLLRPLMVPCDVQIVRVEKDGLWLRWGGTYLAHNLQLNTWTKVAGVVEFGIYPHTNSLVSL